MFSETFVVLGLLAFVYITVYYVWTWITDRQALLGIPSVTVWSSAGFNVLPNTSSIAPESEQIMGWLERKCIELDTPILQIRTGLPGKPNLVVADSLEYDRQLFIPLDIGTTANYKVYAQDPANLDSSITRIRQDKVSGGQLPGFASLQPHDYADE